MKEIANLHYFLGRGRAETTRWMLAVNQIEFKNIPIETPSMLAAIKSSGKLPFDQIPLLEIDGLNLSQSSAMVRYLARRGKFYPEDPKEAVWCDMIAGAVADFAEAAMQAAFQPTKEKATSDLIERFTKFGPRFEQRLIDNGSGFSVGTKLTFADVLLAESLNSYLDWIPDILQETPRVSALYQRVINTHGISNYLKSDQRYPVADDRYIIDVARVLKRYLPAHMDRPDRFV